jgi:hypothetical protein
MIKQEFIDKAFSQRETLLAEKNKLGFLQKLFFRDYTDWVITDEIFEFERQVYYRSTSNPIGPPRTHEERTLIRLRIEDGLMDIKKIRL